VGAEPFAALRDARAKRVEGALNAAPPAYRVERIHKLDPLLARLEAAGGAATAFQSAAWLEPFYEVLVPGVGATPLGLVVTELGSGELAVMLPLALRREGLLTIARFPDFGLSDYGAPILGAKAPADAAGAAALWAAVRAALAGVDIIQLSEMPGEISGRVNPLALLPGLVPSRHSHHALRVPDTVEAFVRSRGKKYRKELDRCFRVLAKQGPIAFRRAETAAEIEAVYAVLEAQQRARRTEVGGGYALDRAECSRFYATLLHRKSASGFAHLFTLAVGGSIIATVLGITHNGAFTLLRISTDGRWRQASPGRLVVVEVMRYFVARGVTTFDMGIGDYLFKHRFGAVSEPLVDLVQPLTWKGVPRAVALRTKARLRRSLPLKVVAAFLRNEE
jgi:CelD/BcsL family acetyltransferase involved in cellulose biosynthesis